MKNQKKYPFDTKEDFVKGFYLVGEHAIRYLYRYRDLLMNFESDIISNAKKILVESMIKTDSIIEGDFDTLLIELRKDKNKAVVQSASLNLNLRYSDFKDYEERLNFNYGALLNTFGDSAGMSYRRLRDEYNKKKEKLPLPLLKDNELVNKTLNDCLKSRNYAHHFSEPKVLSWRRFREEQIKAFPSVVWPPSDIEITRCDITNIISLFETFNFFSHYFDLFNSLQFMIRNDYCILATGTGCKGNVKFDILDKVEDYSAIVISEQGGTLYSE